MRFHSLARASLGLSASLLALAACGDDARRVGVDGGVASPGNARGDAGGLAGDGGSVLPGNGDGGAVNPGVISGGSQPDDPIAIDGCGGDNAAGLNASQVAALMAGGSGAAPRVLYPYDGTVFPRGLTAPTLMWDGTMATAAFVHIESGLFEYRGCVPVSNGSVQIPQAAWDAAGGKTRAGSDFSLEITTLDGSGASARVSQHFTIANATLKGSIYYNSYNSQIGAAGGLAGGLTGGLIGGLAGGLGGGGSLGGVGAGGGSVLRLKPGHMPELFVRQGSCTGCHSVSANGQRLLAAEIGIGGGGGVFGGVGGGIAGAGNGQIYSIDPMTSVNPAPARAGNGVAFAGITPDGKYYLSSGSQAGFGPLLNGGTAPPAASAQLYQTDSGNAVQSGIPASAMMPSFSADGHMLTFSDFNTNGGRSLFVMDFDPSTGAAQNARNVYTAQNGFVGWPFVLPDNRGLVFTVTESSQFSGEAVGITPGKTRGPRSDLMFIDLRTNQARVLSQAMGYRTPADTASDTTYLPFGSEELHQVYYPTASPVAAGGFFWVFFDSVRHVGTLGLRRQLWATAIRIPSSGEFTDYADDPSAPAFHLEGQEVPVANHRAFTALDPCRVDGQSCESGIDCCTGFCTNGVCGFTAPRCSLDGEACKAASDCCDPALSCIGGYCSVVLR